MSPWLRELISWALAALGPLLVGLVVQGVRYLGAKMHLTLTEMQQKQLTFALEQGVAAAAERYRATPNAGGVKASFALEQAKSLAPTAMKKVNEEVQRVLVEATYAKLRPSLPAPSYHMTPGSEIPVDIVEDNRPTPLPPLKRPLP